MGILLDVINVQAQPGHQLILQFENGELRRFDMFPYMNQTRTALFSTANFRFTSEKTMNPHQSTPETILPPVRLDIPQDILDSARLNVDDMKLELAVALYAQRRLSVGKARELAGLSLWEFRQILASRKIPPHYDTEDLAEELATLQALGEDL